MTEEEVETSIADEVLESSTEPKSEEKGYLARDEYTSERFKLEINNLPKYFGFGVSIFVHRNRFYFHSQLGFEEKIETSRC